ncbi:hypothetical protein [Sulfobacillus sp. hq2]|uniref:hypothetical protein n=1 Tax=Sulfobacillus TaxID=28033 RepID=UPI000CD2BE9C|nr:hypothetical protein [Sulfobacillus sp. hq2]POB11767.1 hypothetical protein CO251_02890 [Sulfobacillus sp. hq2]
MISEQDLRHACRQEHRAILVCCAQWDTTGGCSSALEEELQHHHIVLSVLRDYLMQQYHEDLHQ